MIHLFSLIVLLLTGSAQADWGHDVCVKLAPDDEICVDITHGYAPIYKIHNGQLTNAYQAGTLTTPMAFRKGYHEITLDLTRALLASESIKVEVLHTVSTETNGISEEVTEDNGLGKIDPYLVPGTNSKQYVALPIDSTGFERKMWPFKGYWWIKVTITDSWMNIVASGTTEKFYVK